MGELTNERGPIGRGAAASKVNDKRGVLTQTRTWRPRDHSGAGVTATVKARNHKKRKNQKKTERDSWMATCWGVEGDFVWRFWFPAGARDRIRVHRAQPAAHRLSWSYSNDYAYVALRQPARCK